MRKVNFFIVGAAKSGTTSLWKYFSFHPDVYTTGDELYKEPAFFAPIGQKMGADRYHSLYSGATNEKYICDASTAYLTSQESAELICKYNPNAKIVAIIRNPIERSYSLYNWMASEGYEWAPTFEFALKLEDIRWKCKGSFLIHQYFWNYMYIRSGLYVEQLDRFRLLFGDNLKVVKFEEMISNQYMVTKEICDFLDICHYSASLPSENISRSSRFPPLTFAARKVTNVLWLFSDPSSKYSRDRLVNVTLSKKRPRPMAKGTRAMLAGKFEASLRLLEKKYGLSYWDDVVSKKN